MSAGNRIRGQCQGHALVAVILGGRVVSFLNQLSPCFDPVVRGVALQGKLDPPLRDKICANPDFFIGRFMDRGGRGSFFGSHRLDRTNGFLLRRRLFSLGIRCRANCFRFRCRAAVGTASGRFRAFAVRLFFCFDFGFSGHVLLSPIESQIY
jgi:hypothetical protein